MKAQYYLSFLFLISIIIIGSTNEAYQSIKDIPKQKVGFSELNLLKGNSRPLYYIDINNDKITDIIATCSNGSGETVCYYIFDKDLKQYILSEEVKGLSFSDSTIENLIANDLNQDGFMDLIITIKDNKTSKKRTEIFIWNEAISSFESKYSLNEAQSNFFVGDLGDKRGLNIMFYSEGKRQVLSFDSNGTAQVFDFNTLIGSNLNICSASAKHSAFDILSPHSSGIIDINGDCLNDLLIMSTDGTKKYLEIWIGVIENDVIKYCLTSTNVYELETNLGLFTIADVDRDALPDIVFPVLNSSPPQIVIAYNKKAIEYSWTSNYCEDHLPIKLTSSTSIKAVFDDIHVGTNSMYIQTITLMTDINYTFYNDNELYPAFLRFADINQDSYPDFTIVLYNKSSQARTAYIFLSQEIKYDSSYNGPIRRTFSLSDSYSFPSVSNAIVSSFIDFEETGKMDLVIISGTIANVHVSGFYNHNGYDSYTMKSTLLSESNKFYSTEYGATFRFITTNINGSRRMDLSIQFPQPGTLNGLSFPSGYLGIGRSNNYIENFIIISGNYVNMNDNQKLYTPVIPNSQLVIFHTDKELNSTSTASSYTEWKVDLIVKPTQGLNLMIAVIVIMIVIMSTMTVRLQLKEWDEDSNVNLKNFAPWFG